MRAVSIATLSTLPRPIPRMWRVRRSMGLSSEEMNAMDAQQRASISAQVTTNIVSVALVTVRKTASELSV